MPDCSQLDSLVTPYVDGELNAIDRQAVDQHVRVCPACRTRVLAEQAVRDLIRARQSALNADSAPPALRGRCARRLSSGSAPTAVGMWRTRAAPIALAATLVLSIGGALLYEMTDRSARLMAAELTADHLKCFRVNKMLGTHQAPTDVERSLASRFEWQVRLPEEPDRVDLELVGARPCLYAEGRIAHIMYRHNGHPVSVFMLPRAVRSAEVVEVMGHKAAIWSVGDRTFVLIAREPRAEVERLAAFVHATLQ